jgi:hypothetical protein
MWLHRRCDALVQSPPQKLKKARKRNKKSDYASASQHVVEKPKKGANAFTSQPIRFKDAHHQPRILCGTCISRVNRCYRRNN